MRPEDFGPIYAETVMGRFPVEPWNTASNLCFLLIILVFARRSRLNFKRYPLVVVSLPILALGFIGGTVFHATRSGNLWLRMDYMPIIILSLLAAFYFWREYLGNSVRAGIVVLLIFMFVRLTWFITDIPMIARISISYIGLAAALLGPALLLCARERWVDAKYLIFASLSFALAITFRTIDQGLGVELLPMGTHFLWHAFGALSTFLMFNYIIRRYERSNQSN